MLNKWYYLRHEEYSRNNTRKARTVDLDTSSILVDLLRFNETRYLAWHLSFYWDSGILKFEIYFRPMMTRVSCTRFPEYIKTIFYGHHHAHKETQNTCFYRSCYDFLCILGFCTKLLPDVQVWIKKLCHTITINICCAVNYVPGFMQNISIYKNKSKWVLELILV